jgi:hypothetical protein
MALHNNEMQLTGGEGCSRGVGLAMRRAGYPARARIFKHPTERNVNDRASVNRHRRQSC